MSTDNSGDMTVDLPVRALQVMIANLNSTIETLELQRRTLLAKMPRPGKNSSKPAQIGKDGRYCIKNPKRPAK